MTLTSRRINSWAHPGLMGSFSVKCHNRCKGKEFMQHKPFSVINVLTLIFWPLKSIWHILDSWGVFASCLMRRGVKKKQLCHINYLQLSMHCDLTFEVLNLKWIGRILDSWGVFVWSFIMICVKGKQFYDINHFQLSMHCDLYLLNPKSIGHISRLMRGLSEVTWW